MTTRRETAFAGFPRLLREAERRTRGSLGLLPDFLIIGAQKGGTTSLFHYLGRHPGILSSHTKELHFFDRNYRRGTRWYRSRFPSGAVKLGLLLRHRHPVRVGEASPFYFFHPEVPARIRATIPNARYILLLRNPIDRAYSHYRMQVSRGQETLSFEEAIEAGDRRLAGESLTSAAMKHHSYLARGRYLEQLLQWRRHFPLDRFLILRSEDFFADPGRTVGEVHRWLGLPVRPLDDARNYFPGGYQEPIPPAVRRRLADYFAPLNRALYDYLGVDFGWS